MFQRLLVLIVCLGASASSLGAVLIEGGTASERVRSSRNSVRTSSKEAAYDGLSMRDQRKVGLGFATAGPNGLFGVNIELNFSSTTSFRTGFGLGVGYNTFHIEIKKMISGTWFVPYMSAGFARWMGRGSENIEESSPSFLSERFLNTTERQTGKFQQNMIFPGLGIQYHQLNGEYAGSSVYAEVLMMIDIDDFVAAPTGEIGYVYYF